MTTSPMAALPAAAIVCLAGAALASAQKADSLLVEAESFRDPGGWVVDQQFIDAMGSPYLLAHGLGKPCANATTAATLPAAGRYRVWVRTKDWIAEPNWAPGQFKLVINGKALAETFGTKGDGAWIWQDGGDVQMENREASLELQDLTGFEGRCDAIFFTTDANARPPTKADAEMAQWRRSMLGLEATPTTAGEFDVVVVGGGIAGCSAAITAARLGARVALVEDRPVLGGNNSPEIRVHTGGWGIPGKLVAPEVSGDFGHRASDSKWWDPAASPVEAAERKRRQAVEGEKNIRLFLGWRVYSAAKTGGRIVSVDARDIRTGREQRIAGWSFIDCTGDGWVGYYAGADFRHGQEGRDETHEPLAPEKPVKMTLGTSLLWYAAAGAKPAEFPDVPWATAVSKNLAATSGDWQWEYGHYRDTIWEAEEIRDHLFRAAYGAFATTKRKDPVKYANYEIQHLNYVAGKRESRRLMGPYVMAQTDCTGEVTKPDKVAIGGNPFDLHVPTREHDFLIRVDPRVSLKERTTFDIPLRCLYSRNVANLLMAGRCISATRIAHSCLRLQNTGGQTGVAAGAAAYLCKKHGATPDGIYRDHLAELQDIVFDRGQYKGALAAKADK